MTYVLIYKKLEQERMINLVLESHRREVINVTKETDDNKHKSVNGSIQPASANLQLCKPLSQNTVVKRKKEKE